MNYTYMLQCKDGSYYTGWTNDIKKRLEQHRQGKGAKYTRGRGPLTLVHLEVFETKSEAMQREAQIKAMDRRDKCQILEDQSWKEQLAVWGLLDLQIQEAGEEYGTD